MLVYLLLQMYESIIYNYIAGTYAVLQKPIWQSDKNRCDLRRTYSR